MKRATFLLFLLTLLVLIPPKAHAALPHVTAVSAGDFHTCAVVDGGAKCWGGNYFGELGNGATGISTLPVDVIGLSSGVRAISAGARTTCAIRKETAYCWGDWFHPSPSNPTIAGSPTALPVRVPSLSSGVTAISVGQNSICAIKFGSAYCWGPNRAGQVGDGSFAPRLTPTQVKGISAVVSIATGSDRTCAVTQSSETFCWGVGAGSPTPVRMSGLRSNGVAISVGLWHACAVDGNADAYCWGDNTFGELGDGSTTSQTQPVHIAGSMRKISAGRHQTCGIVGTTAWCWGAGTLLPTPVSGFDHVSHISVGITICAVNAERLWCWGFNRFGQLGNGTTISSGPVEVKL